MGLDQYAYATTHGPGKWSKKTELSYWRKHPNLQGWMGNKYEEKHNDYEEFNCKKLYLDRWDLDELESAILNQLLPETTGFFFGNPSDVHYREQDLEFVQKARYHLSVGDKVYYTCWY